MPRRTSCSGLCSLPARTTDLLSVEVYATTEALGEHRSKLRPPGLCKMPMLHSLSPIDLTVVPVVVVFLVALIDQFVGFGSIGTSCLSNVRIPSAPLHKNFTSNSEWFRIDFTMIPHRLHDNFTSTHFQCRSLFI